MVLRGKKIYVILAICLSLIGFMAWSGFSLTDEVSHSPLTIRKKQIEYLKEHEEEIIDFVKGRSAKIESVQIDWGSMRVGPIGGLPFNNDYNLSLRGHFNQLENTYFTVDFTLENPNDLPDIKQIGSLHHLRIIRDNLDDIFE